MSKILITRPIKQAKAMISEIEALGFEPLIAPVMEIEEVAFDVPDHEAYDALLLTSSNAVRIFAKALPEGSPYWNKALFCVGNKTAATAQKYGFTTIHSADGDVKNLITMIRDHNGDNQKPYLHIRGHHAARPLHVWLAQYDIAVDILPVYKTNEIANWSDDVINAYRNQDIQAVIHMSPRSAKAYVRAVETYDLQAAHDSIKSLSISPAVLECVQSLPWKETYAAEKPGKGRAL